MEYLRATGATIMETVLDVLFAYNVFVVCEVLALVERGWNLAKKLWRRQNRRGPVRPRPRCLVRGNYTRVVLGLMLTVGMVLFLFYSALTSSQDKARNLSAQEWQVKYEDLLCKHSVDSMRSRMKYDKLAGKYVELQTDYEALREPIRSKPQHTSRSSKANVESYGSDTVQGPFAVVRDVLAVAEKSVYDMYMHFRTLCERLVVECMVVAAAPMTTAGRRKNI